MKMTEKMETETGFEKCGLELARNRRHHHSSVACANDHSEIVLFTHTLNQLLTYYPLPPILKVTKPATV